MTLFSPSVTPYSILAVLGWLVGGGLVVYDLLVVSNDIGHVGILVAGAAGVLQVRGMIHHLEAREKTIFELGRESGRLHRVD